MAFDARAIFANLAEKERIKGHHSPEGSAIRTLSRALSGWSDCVLSGRDVIVLCNQALEDWLNARLGVSRWASRTIDNLVRVALSDGLITPQEGEKLVQLHRARLQSSDTSDREASEALEFCIDLIDKRW